MASSTTTTRRPPKFIWHVHELSTFKRLMNQQHPEMMLLRKSNTTASSLAQSSKKLWSNVASNVSEMCPRSDGKPWKTKQLRDKFRNEVYSGIDHTRVWPQWMWEQFAEAFAASYRESKKDVFQRTFDKMMVRYGKAPSPLKMRNNVNNAKRQLLQAKESNTPVSHFVGKSRWAIPLVLEVVLAMINGTHDEYQRAAANKTAINNNTWPTPTPPDEHQPAPSPTSVATRNPHFPPFPPLTPPAVNQQSVDEAIDRVDALAAHYQQQQPGPICFTPAPATMMRLPSGHMSITSQSGMTTHNDQFSVASLQVIPPQALAETPLGLHLSHPDTWDPPLEPSLLDFLNNTHSHAPLMAHHPEPAPGNCFPKSIQEWDNLVDIHMAAPPITPHQPARTPLHTQSPPSPCYDFQQPYPSPGSNSSGAHLTHHFMDPPGEMLLSDRSQLFDQAADPTHLLTTLCPLPVYLDNDVTFDLPCFYTDDDLAMSMSMLNDINSISALG